MHSAKEKLSNLASAAKEKVTMCSARTEEKVEKAHARTKEEVVIAHEHRKAKEAAAKAELHEEKAEHAAEKLYGKHHLLGQTAAYHQQQPPAAVGNQYGYDNQPVMGAHHHAHNPVGMGAAPTYPQAGYPPAPGHKYM